MSVSRKVLRRVKKAMGVGAIPVLAACSSQISRAAVNVGFDPCNKILYFSGDGVIDESWQERYTPESIKHIVIEDGIKEIGYCAFDGCSFLEEINISSSVTTIGGHAFSGCKSLEKINIPGPVTEIGMRAFEYCDSLKEINIPKSVANIIGKYAFSGCKSLKEITIPDSVTSIDDYAFSGCKSLEKINIPGPVTEIGRRAFEYCESLKEINIPKSVNIIGEYAFSGCKSLKEINIPVSVTTVGYGTFKNCFGLKTVRFGYDDNRRKNLRALDFFLHNKNNKKEVVSKLRKGLYGNLRPDFKEFLFREDEKIIIKKNAFANCKSLNYLDTNCFVVNCEEGAFRGTPLFQNFVGKVICGKYRFPYHQDMVAKALLLDSINDRFNKDGDRINPVDCPLRYPPFGHSCC